MEKKLVGLRAKLTLVALACAGVALFWAILTSALSEHFVLIGDGDRAAAFNPGSSEALLAKAQSLADDGDDEGAIEVARRSLQRSPLRAGALRVLAMAASVEGRSREASLTMARAVVLNPRDVAAQSWILERAVLAGDGEAAILSADYLMRQSHEVRETLSFSLLPLFRTSDGSRTIAGKLVEMPPWRGEFLDVVDQYATPEQVRDLFRRLSLTPKPVTDQEARPFILRLLMEDDYELARQVWQPMAKQDAARALVYDGGFEGLPGPQPLNWEAMPVIGAYSGWRRSDGVPTGHLLLRHDGYSDTRALVRQLIYLKPGMYGMSLKMTVQDIVADERFSLDVHCVSGVQIGTMSLRGRPGRIETSRGRFTVPDTGCPAQWLYFLPQSSERREMVDVQIDDLEIHPADRGVDAGVAQSVTAP